MEKIIKAKFKKGVLEPLEKLNIEEGREISITIMDLPVKDSFEKAAGSWKNLVDCEALLKDIYEGRKIRRPAVKL